MLRSLAQFDRGVTAEPIRDKIAVKVTRWPGRNRSDAERTSRQTIGAGSSVEREITQRRA